MVPQDMLTKCKCRKPFSVDHSLNCPKGGFPTIRHNEVHDLTASLLSIVCHDVRGLNPTPTITGETVTYRTANTDIEAGSDISHCDFWQLHFKSSWLFAFSTPMLNHTTISPRKPASDNMSRRRGVGMANASGK